MEQDTEFRNEPPLSWPINLQQRKKEYDCGPWGRLGIISHLKIYPVNLYLEYNERCKVVACKILVGPNH